MILLLIKYKISMVSFEYYEVQFRESESFNMVNVVIGRVQIMK